MAFASFRLLWYADLKIHGVENQIVKKIIHIFAVAFRKDTSALGVKHVS